MFNAHHLSRRKGLHFTRHLAALNRRLCTAEATCCDWKRYTTFRSAR